MKDHEILDNPSTRKRSRGHWRGAKYFGMALAFGVSGLLISLALEYFIGKPLLAWQDYPSIFGGILYLFFNAMGVVVSLNYLIVGHTRDERIAGVVSLLLNLSPYLIVGKLWYF